MPMASDTAARLLALVNKWALASQCVAIAVVRHSCKALTSLRQRQEDHLLVHEFNMDNQPRVSNCLQSRRANSDFNTKCGGAQKQPGRTSLAASGFTCCIAPLSYCCNKHYMSVTTRIILNKNTNAKERNIHKTHLLHLQQVGSCFLSQPSAIIPVKCARRCVSIKKFVCPKNQQSKKPAISRQNWLNKRQDVPLPRPSHLLYGAVMVSLPYLFYTRHYLYQISTQAQD